MVGDRADSESNRTSPGSPLDRTETLLRQSVDFIRPHAAYLLIVVAAIAAYANTLGNTFTFDDQIIVLKNPRITQLNRLDAIFGTSYWNSPNKNAEYRPVTILSYALNHKWNRMFFAPRPDEPAGLSPVSYHLANVLLHALASFLAAWAVFGLFRRKFLAAVAGLFFALHPVHTEAVAGVVGRAEILAAIGVFGALGAWGRIRQAVTARQSALWAALGGLAFAIGIFSKENAITLLGVLVLEVLVFARLARITGEGTGIRKALLRAWPLALVLVGVCLVYLAARVSVVGAITRPGNVDINFVENPAFNLPWDERIMTALRTQGEYLWLLVWPENLIADFSYDAYPLSHSFMETGVFLGTLAVAGLGLAVLIGLWEGPIVAFAAGFYLITMSVTANIFFPIGTIKGERLLYLPSFGFCLLLALIFERLWTRRHQIQWRIPLAAVITIICVAYFARTYQRNPVWENDYTLFAATVQAVPRNIKAHNNLANYLISRGRYGEALDHVNRVLEIDREKRSPYALGHQATIFTAMANQARNEAQNLLRRGETEKARARQQEAYRLLTQADQAYQEALEAAPNFLLTHQSYGIFLCRYGEYERGLDHLEIAHQQNPRDIDPLFSLVYYYWMYAGSADDPQAPLNKSIEYGQKLLEINPRHYETLVRIGTSYFELDQYEQAVNYLSRAVSIPGTIPSARTWNVLGGSYYHLNDLDQAETAFETALGVEQEDPLAQRGLLLIQKARQTGVRDELRPGPGASTRPMAE